MLQDDKVAADTNNPQIQREEVEDKLDRCLIAIFCSLAAMLGHVNTSPCISKPGFGSRTGRIDCFCPACHLPDCDIYLAVYKQAKRSCILLLYWFYLLPWVCNFLLLCKLS